MLTRFLLRASASRNVSGPSKRPSEFCGAQPSALSSGASLMRVAGITPCSSAAEYKNGLKLDPGWRQAWVTWLNGWRVKSKPPTSARTRPLTGSSATNAACTSGHWVTAQRALSAAPVAPAWLAGPAGPGAAPTGSAAGLPLAAGTCHTRTMSPRSIARSAGARAASPAWATRKPSPVMRSASPLASCRRSSRGLAESTMATRNNSSSGWSRSASAAARSMSGLAADAPPSAPLSVPLRRPTCARSAGKSSWSSGPRQGWRAS